MKTALKLVVFVALLAPSAQAQDGANAYRKSVDSVALVYASDGQGHRSIGSAVVLSTDGLLLTAHHVVKASKFALVMFPSRAKDGHVIAELEHYTDNVDRVGVLYIVIGVDQQRDLAFLAPKERRRGMRAIPMIAGEVAPGEQVFAIGSGVNSLFRYSSGVVKQVHSERFTTDQATIAGRIIQSSTDVAPGDSGGPLLSMKGELVGINLAMDRASGIRKSIAVSEVNAFLEEFTAKLDAQLKEAGKN